MIRKSEMSLMIADRCFKVLISGWAIRRGGHPRRAWIDSGGGRILISGDEPRHERRVLLWHEARHAWTNHYGRPRDDNEDDAMSAAAFVDALLPQYLSQGGDATLEAMEPPPELALPAGFTGAKRGLPGMTIRVGPWRYRVRVSAEPLFAGEEQAGEEQAGLCIWCEHVILISSAIPRKRRLEVLLHEVVHAWRWAFGRPINDEADANNVAAFAASVLRDLLRQGGERALRELEPVAEDRHAFAARQ